MDHGTRRQSIVETILGQLFQGRIKPRERLRVEHLAEQFEVSVTPIREALVELAGLGVIELQANRGAVVCDFGPLQVLEIYHLRRILECEATRGACDRIAPFELESLRGDHYGQMNENAEHLAIVDALNAGDADLAANAMAYHLSQSANALVQDLFTDQQIEVERAVAFLQTRASSLTVPR